MDLGILRGRGKLIHEKNPKLKLSWRFPFNISKVRKYLRQIQILSVVIGKEGLKHLPNLFFINSQRFQLLLYFESLLTCVPACLIANNCSFYRENEQNVGSVCVTLFPSQSLIFIMVKSTISSLCVSQISTIFNEERGKR